MRKGDIARYEPCLFSHRVFKRLALQDKQEFVFETVKD